MATITATTKSLLEKVDASHDWKEKQTFRGTGLQLSKTDECRICGLQRRWLFDPHNGLEYNRYNFELENQDLTLKRTAQLPACIKEIS